MTKSMIDQNYRILLEGTALKLKYVAKDYIHFIVGQHIPTGNFVLAIADNDNSGLYSKEWIELSAIYQLLSTLNHSHFRSQVFDALFQNRSRNNRGFLTAILKSESLNVIEPVSGQPFEYKVVEKYTEKFAQLEITLKKLSEGEAFSP